MQSGGETAIGSETNGAAKRTSSVSSTYQLKEDEFAKQQQSPQRTCSSDGVMVKQNGEEYEEGAQERMLKDDSTQKIAKDSTEVKFISENGDAKIDIGVINQASAMGKEELMKFVNDPFWVRMRWILFIGFWLLWAAMLAGAIAIIVMAPKCSAPEPKKLWEESPIVQLDNLDNPTKQLKELEPILYELKDLNVKAISLSSLIKRSSDGGIEDYRAIQREFGDISDLEALIKVANTEGQQIFLELDPNHSSVQHPWFKRSVEKQEPFTSYYVWANGIMDGGKRKPPNNWLSVYGESAWEWNEQRGQYYLHQFNKTQPDLNYNNSAVVKEFGDILTHWLKLGISGFRLANTQYLTEDPDLRDESRSHLAIEFNNYQSLTHVHTRGRAENAAILMKWRGIVHNATDGKGLFALQDDIGADILHVYNLKDTLIDLPQSSHFLTAANFSINATTLHKSISQWIEIAPWPAWNVNGKVHSIRERMPRDVADSITLMTMLLPGTPIFRLSDVRSTKDAFKILSNARTTPTFLYGNTMTRIVQKDVFVYTRLKSGNPGYLVAYHTGNDNITIDLSSIPHISEEVNIVAYSSNYAQGLEVTKKLFSDRVPITAQSVVVLTFVQKE
ncbi:neutral and basic amino acid transport protein rBAT isoform X2 [Odontomachus brunneus]|uniref:neutral and basic amino acid transport protein rBAT isoform X2 n=1 Tax=Odontomachus brunneus TaxID=486640 RepID=UPI0013F1A40B|nr:neutral and basic amino acid transport protein rBAT isoform X2 [Odontomachus brunneus]